MTESLAFPAPEAGDPEDVAWNLQTGGTMWARGDHHEAVRWLRRAAEAASDAGSDMRALSLARAAADLTQALELPPSILPPPSAPITETTPVPTPVAVRPAPPAVAPLHPDEATTPRPMPVSRPKAPPPSPHDEATVHDYTIPAGVEAMERSVPPASRRPPPPLRSSPSAAPPPLRSSPSGTPPSGRSSPSAAPPPPSRSSPSAAPLSSPTTSRSSPSASSSSSTFRPRQALRVAVTPSPEDKTLMLVRALTDEEPVPPGAHEALLTALEAGVHLTSKKR